MKLIPLLPGKKKTWIKNYQNKTQEELLDQVTSFDDINYGIQLGIEERCCIDADDNFFTAEQTEQFLENKRYAKVSSLDEGHYHYHFRLSNIPKNVKASIQLPHPYDGHLKVHTHYVVAPGSIIDGKEYRLVDGELNDLSSIDFLEIIEFFGLSLEQTVKHDHECSDELPIELSESPIAKSCQNLLNDLRYSRKRENVRSYASTSEAVMAATMNLILDGFIKEDIKKLLDLPSHRSWSWWERSVYPDAIHQIMSNHNRKAIANFLSNPFSLSGRNANSKELVLREILFEMFRSGNFGCNISDRSIMLRSGISSPTTITRAKRGLVDDGFILYKVIDDHRITHYELTESFILMLKQSEYQGKKVRFPTVLVQYGLITYLQTELYNAVLYGVQERQSLYILFNNRSKLTIDWGIKKLIELGLLTKQNEQLGVGHESPRSLADSIDPFWEKKTILRSQRISSERQAYRKQFLTPRVPHRSCSKNNTGEKSNTELLGIASDSLFDLPIINPLIAYCNRNSRFSKGIYVPQLKRIFREHLPSKRYIRPP